MFPFLFPFHLGADEVQFSSNAADKEDQTSTKPTAPTGSAQRDTKSSDGTIKNDGKASDTRAKSDAATKAPVKDKPEQATAKKTKDNPGATSEGQSADDSSSQSRHAREATKTAEAVPNDAAKQGKGQGQHGADGGSESKNLKQKEAPKAKVKADSVPSTESDKQPKDKKQKASTDGSVKGIFEVMLFIFLVFKIEDLRNLVKLLLNVV